MLLLFRNHLFNFVFNRVLFILHHHQLKLSVQVHELLVLATFGVRQNSLNQTAQRPVFDRVNIKHAILEQVKIADLHGLHGDMLQPPP